MSTALDHVFNTTELLEMILLAPPFSEILRARQISRAFRDVLDASPFIKRIRTNPYIGVYVRLPSLCSISEGEAPTLEADLVLYHDKPLTVYTFRDSDEFPSQMFYKLENGHPSPQLDPGNSSLTLLGPAYSSKPERFAPHRADIRLKQDIVDEFMLTC
jgi:hypothetical protein